MVVAYCSSAYSILTIQRVTHDDCMPQFYAMHKTAVMFTSYETDKTVRGIFMI